MKLSERFLNLFEGFKTQYGTYDPKTVKQAVDRIKTEIRHSAKTLRGNVTAELWERHLAGAQPLGIIPINEQSQCRWGCIDIDDYAPRSLEDLAKRFGEMYPNFVICRSKSGNAHAYIFLNEYIPAGEMRAKLYDIAGSMGFANRERFPKQETIADPERDSASWLNMPYFGGNTSLIVGFGHDGRYLTTEQFVDFCVNRRMSASDFFAIPIFQGDNLEDWLKVSPPCISPIVIDGIPDGTRNTVLCHLATLARKMYPDNWEAKLEEWNSKYCSPPLSSEEITSIKKSYRKKEYNYKCKESPMSEHCNVAVCRTRKYGIGKEENNMPTITSLTISLSDPPLYYLDIDGVRIEMTHEDLVSPRRCQLLVLQKTNRMMPIMKQTDWTILMNVLLDEAVRIPAPYGSSEEELFQEHLEEFFNQKAKSESKEDIPLGNIWYDPESDYYHFRLKDFCDFLIKNDYPSVQRNKIARKLEDLYKFRQFQVFGIKGSSKNCFRVPSSFVKSIEADSVGRVPEYKNTTDVI